MNVEIADQVRDRFSRNWNFLRHVIQQVAHHDCVGMAAEIAFQLMFAFTIYGMATGLTLTSHRADAAGNAKSYAGESYVIFGADFTGGIVFAGTGGAGLPDRHRRS
jgi:hypothetical protein